MRQLYCVDPGYNAVTLPGTLVTLVSSVSLQAYHSVTLLWKPRFSSLVNLVTPKSPPIVSGPDCQCSSFHLRKDLPEDHLSLFQTVDLHRPLLPASLGTPWGDCDGLTLRRAMAPFK